MAFFSPFGALIPIVIVIVAVALIGKAVNAAAGTKKPPQRPAARPPQPPQKPCPNPEQHRHYEAAPRQSVTASDNQRRRENARRLYDAGLLTREEYDAEVRRYQ